MGRNKYSAPLFISFIIVKDRLPMSPRITPSSETVSVQYAPRVREPYFLLSLPVLSEPYLFKASNNFTTDMRKSDFDWLIARKNYYRLTLVTPLGISNPDTVSSEPAGVEVVPAEATAVKTRGRKAKDKEVVPEPEPEPVVSVSPLDTDATPLPLMNDVAGW